MLETLLTRKQAAAKSREYGEVYAVAETTLAKLACIGGGPPFIKFGHRVGYRESELIEWLRSRTRVVEHTSSQGKPLAALDDKKC